MPFERGKPKTGGRIKGVKNKPRLDLLALCAEQGIDVFYELLEMASSEMDTHKRFEKFKELAPYLYPKQRSIDVTMKSEIEAQAEAFEKLDPDKRAELLEVEAKRIRGEI